MANQTLARRYAIAVYSLAAQADAVDRIGEDLQRIFDGIEGNDEVRRFFFAPIIDRYRKEQVLATAFEGRVDDVALHTLLLLVRKHRESLLRTLLEQYRALEMSGRGVEALTVTSARPLSEHELATIAGRVEGIYGRRFEAHLVVDSQLVGGIRITMGDRRVDGTIAGRLEQLARTLSATA